MKVESHAKINLALDVLGRDPSGYHLIQTIFHEIDLTDEMEFTEIPKGIEIVCKSVKNENLAEKAAKLLKNRFKIDHGIRIEINKRIPIAAGLGGGSSNAAVTLKTLNSLWNLGLSLTELADLAAELGMDVPFFIYGGTALGEHFGEKITPLPRVTGLKIEIHPQSIRVGTASAYASLDLSRSGLNIDKTEQMLKTIHARDFQKIPSLIHNDFQKTPAPPYLTGSGPTTYSIF